VIIAKFNRLSGQIIWARQFGTSGGDIGNVLYMTDSGILMIFAELNGRYGDLSHFGSGDIYVAAFNPRFDQVMDEKVIGTVGSDTIVSKVVGERNERVWGSGRSNGTVCLYEFDLSVYASELQRTGALFSPFVQAGASIPNNSIAANPVSSNPVQPTTSSTNLSTSTNIAVIGTFQANVEQIRHRIVSTSSSASTHDGVLFDSQTKEKYLCGSVTAKYEDLITVAPNRRLFLTKFASNDSIEWTRFISSLSLSLYYICHF
jgi:hypothetical protein